MPALHDLVRAGMRTMTSGDSSQWDQALQMPHYSTFAMPTLSLHCGAHVSRGRRLQRGGRAGSGCLPAGEGLAVSSCPPLPPQCPQFAQWARDASGFRLFDYGTAAANRQHYGEDRPPSLGGEIRRHGCAVPGGRMQVSPASAASQWAALPPAAPSNQALPHPAALTTPLCTPRPHTTPHRALPPAGPACGPAGRRGRRHHPARLRAAARAAPARRGRALLLPHPALRVRGRGERHGVAGRSAGSWDRWLLHMLTAARCVERACRLPPPNPPPLRPTTRHMEFTLGVRDDIRMYVLSKLRQPLP